jgi:hypothetical protein
MALDTDAKRIVYGRRAVQRYFQKALARIAEHSRTAMGNCPTLIGEFGLPFDLNGKKAYKTGDFGAHIQALSWYYNALDANLLSATLWNYTIDTTHEYGDGWNKEDLSVFCKEDGGGRALAGFVRPYALAVAGEILCMQFNREKGRFLLEFVPDFSIEAPTEVYIPMLQFPKGTLLSAWGATFHEAQHSVKKVTKYTRIVAQPSEFLVLQIVAEEGASLCRLLVSRQ